MISSFNSLLCEVKVKAQHTCQTLYEFQLHITQTHAKDTGVALSQWLRTYNLIQTLKKALRVSIMKADEAQTEFMVDLAL